MNPFSNHSDPFADDLSEEQKTKLAIEREFALQTMQQPIFRTGLEQPELLVRGSSLDDEKFRGLAVAPSMGFDLSIPNLHSVASVPLPKGGHDSFSSTFMRPTKTTFDKQTHLTDAIDSLKDMRISQPEVPALPEFYEQYSSFSTNEDPNQVLRKLVHILHRDDSVDFELKADRFKVKGVFYRFSHAVKFHIYIFHKRNVSEGENQEGQYLVEVQRRCGDCMSFMAFYRELAEKLGNAIKTPTRVFTPPDEPISLDSTTLKSLVDMAGCGLVDVANEGARALNELSRHAPNVQVMASDAAFMIALAKLMASDDVESNRHAACLIKKISELPMHRATLITACLSAMTESMNKTLSPEVRRQLASAFALLASTNAAEMLTCPVAKTLSKFEHDGDSRLVPEVMKALDAISSHTTSS